MIVMKFVFEYGMGETDDRIEVVVSDALIARAQDVGYDLVSVETIAKAMIDRFFHRVTKIDVWHRSEWTTK
jgi:hypothetical protein